MSKFLIRIVSLLLVPCLIADPALSASIALSRSAPVTQYNAPSVFDSQALASRSPFELHLIDAAGREPLLGLTHHLPGIRISFQIPLLDSMRRFLRSELQRWQRHPFKTAIALASLALMAWHPAFGTVAMAALSPDDDISAGTPYAVPEQERLDVIRALIQETFPEIAPTDPQLQVLDRTPDDELDRYAVVRSLDLDGKKLKKAASVSGRLKEKRKEWKPQTSDHPDERLDDLMLKAVSLLAKLDKASLEEALSGPARPASIVSPEENQRQFEDLSTKLDAILRSRDQVFASLHPERFNLKSTWAERLFSLHVFKDHLETWVQNDPALRQLRARNPASVNLEDRGLLSSRIAESVIDNMAMLLRLAGYRVSRAPADPKSLAQFHLDDAGLDRTMRYLLDAELFDSGLVTLLGLLVDCPRENRRANRERAEELLTLLQEGPGASGMRFVSRLSTAFVFVLSELTDDEAKLIDRARTIIELYDESGNERPNEFCLAFAHDLGRHYRFVNTKILQLHAEKPRDTAYYEFIYNALDYALGILVLTPLWKAYSLAKDDPKKNQEYDAQVIAALGDALTGLPRNLLDEDYLRTRSNVVEGAKQLRITGYPGSPEIHFYAENLSSTERELYYSLVASRRQSLASDLRGNPLQFAGGESVFSPIELHDAFSRRLLRDMVIVNNDLPPAELADHTYEKLNEASHHSELASWAHRILMLVMLELPDEKAATVNIEGSIKANQISTYMSFEEMLTELSRTPSAPPRSSAQSEPRPLDNPNSRKAPYDEYESGVSDGSLAGWLSGGHPDRVLPLGELKEIADFGKYKPHSNPYFIQGKAYFSLETATKRGMVLSSLGEEKSERFPDHLQGPLVACDHTLYYFRYESNPSPPQAGSRYSLYRRDERGHDAKVPLHQGFVPDIWTLATAGTGVVVAENKAGGYDRRVLEISPSSQRLLAPLPFDTHGPAFGYQDGHLFVAEATDYGPFQLYVYDMEANSWKEAGVLKGHHRKPEFVTSPDGKLFLIVWEQLESGALKENGHWVLFEVTDHGFNKRLGSLGRQSSLYGRSPQVYRYGEELYISQDDEAILNYRGDNHWDAYQLPKSPDRYGIYGLAGHEGEVLPVVKTLFGAV